jgi:hypothetical protein
MSLSLKRLNEARRNIMKRLEILNKEGISQSVSLVISDKTRPQDRPRTGRVTVRISDLPEEVTLVKRRCEQNGSRPMRRYRHVAEALNAYQAVTRTAYVVSDADYKRIIDNIQHRFLFWSSSDDDQKAYDTMVARIRYRQQVIRGDFSKEYSADWIAESSALEKAIPLYVEEI